MATEILTEVCSHCDKEFSVEWDINVNGWIVFCPHCGNKTYMCNMCEPDNMQCNTNNCPAIQQLLTKEEDDN